MKNIKHFNPMKLREKYSANSPVKTSNSSFWMGDNFGRRTSIFDSWGEEEEEVKSLKGLINYLGVTRFVL